MKNIPDKKDDLLGKILGEEFLETPSFNFTDKVMSKLNLSPDSTISTYQPVISTRGWLIIAGIAALLDPTPAQPMVS